jgi:hypothetical protein
MISGLLSPRDRSWLRFETCLFRKRAVEPPFGFRNRVEQRWLMFSDWVPPDSSFYAGQHEKFTPSLSEFVKIGVPVGDYPHNRISYDNLLVTLCRS